MGAIYDVNNATDLSELKFTVETCNEYVTLGESLNSFTMYCASGSDSFSSTDLCGSNNCGCIDVIANNTEFDRTYRGGGCYRNSTVDEECEAGQPCVVYCSSSYASCASKVIDGRKATKYVIYSLLNC